ncbi:MAG: hypothetical protein KKH92_08460 [Firmicutes bacterium]|nr:hypothetical protein [Bacillota bacterium]
MLVDPDDKQQLLKAIQLNSSLWGGTYNPVIPAYRKQPYFLRKDFSRASAKDYVQGYITAFDPDILVQFCTEVPDYIKETNLDIIKSSEVWRDVFKEKRSLSPRYGIGIFEVLDQIYQDHFRYASKYPIQISAPSFSKKDELLWSTIVGNLNEDVRGTVLEYYGEALEVNSDRVSMSDFSSIFQGSNFFPRRISQQYIDTNSSSGIFRAYVYYFDSSKFIDLVDYWNLRAAGRPVFPFPIQYQDNESVRTELVKFLRHYRRPWRHQSETFDHASIVKSHSARMEDMKTVMEDVSDALLMPEKGTHYYSFRHYPRIWNDWARVPDGIDPDTLTHKREDIDIHTEIQDKIRFKPVLPEFSSKFGYSGNPRCGNDVDVRIYGSSVPFADVMPPANTDHVIRAISGITSYKEWRVGRRGLVHLAKDQYTEHWEIPTAENVFLAWLKDDGWSLEISTPGKLARNLYMKLDGFSRIMANEKTVRLLEHLNGGRVNKNLKIDDRAISSELRTAEIGQLHNVLGESRFNYFLEHGAFQLGCEVQCPHCDRRSWHDLNSLHDIITCQKCSEAFDANKTLSDSRWKYKTAGAFSVSSYGEGSFSVLITTSFLNDRHLPGVTFSPVFSFKAEKGNKKLESDFGGFIRESSYGDVYIAPVFGECKSYNEFKDADFRKMKSIAKQYPGSVIVFATLREKFTSKELKQLKSIVNQGRKYWKNEKPRNPVLILTGKELFSNDSPPRCWNDANKKKFDRIHGLLDLCNATQQIYLKMPSWHDEWREEFEKKRKKKI